MLTAPAFQNDCKPDELQCGNGQCIPASLRCNKITDCHDGSDEHHCSSKIIIIWNIELKKEKNSVNFSFNKISAKKLSILPKSILQ